MLLVNSQKIELYSLDTHSSILSRIAARFDTLPKYLYFPSGLNIASKEDTKVTDVLSEIKQDAQKNVNFKAFYDSLPMDVKSNDDILTPWLSYNIQFESAGKFSIVFLQDVAEGLVEEGFIDSVMAFNILWKGRENYKLKLDQLIELNRQQNEDNLKILDIFKQLGEGRVYTPFKISKETLKIFLNLQDITYLEVFNFIVANENLPFLCCKSYYKVLKNFTPLEEWIDSAENYIVAKVNERTDVDLTKFKDYIDIKFFIENNIVTIDVKLRLEKGLVARTEFLNRILRSIQIPSINYTKIEEKFISGVFYLPRLRIDSYVLSELIMNDPIFSSMLVVDEHEKTTKKRTDIGQPWLYAYFNHYSTGEIRASIIQKIMQRGDSEMRDADYEIFPQGEPYIRVNITKANNVESVQTFQEIFSKLMVRYDERYNDIIKIYEQYIPNFGEVHEIEVKESKTGLEKKAPEIFVKKYSRNCSENRAPTMITFEETQEYEKQGLQTMIFPRNKIEDEPKYPSDGLRQQYYVCLNPEYSYPGVQQNKLSNAADYPYLPCCFKTDQTNRSFGTYQEYYENTFREEKEKKQQDLIVTDKFLQETKHGKLPMILQKLFSILNTDVDYDFLRQGVKRDKSSFLRAILSSLNSETGYLNLKEKKKDLEVKQIRSQIAAPRYSAIARQCNYELSSKQISQNTKNLDTYLDPKRYVQVLEKKYDCNIYLFNGEGMLLPRHIQGYYRDNSGKKIVLVYEHWGSESDHALYPQCELIVLFDRKKMGNVISNFSKDHVISKKIHRLFLSLNTSYILNKKIKEVDFPLNFDIVSQEIDDFGKLRKVNIEIDGKEISVLTEPTMPLFVEEAYDKMYKASEKIAVKFSDSLSKTVKNGKIFTLNSIVGNVSISIPVKGSFDLDLKESIGLNYVQSQNSDLNQFNYFKKISRYIVEYLFWLFSRFIYKNNMKEITDNVLNSFAENTLVVNADFKYEVIPKKFKKAKEALTKDGKLVVLSQDMLRRVMYMLKLYALRDLETLREYRNRKYIENYYLDITDFDKHENELILKGQSAIEKWILYNRNNYELYDSVQSGIIVPYFFKNFSIENKVFIAQNCRNLQHALNVAITWNEEKINLGHEIGKNVDTDVSFILYTYGKNGFVRKNVRGSRKPVNPVQIIGYKIESSSFYTALLDM